MSANDSANATEARIRCDNGYILARLVPTASMIALVNRVPTESPALFSMTTMSPVFFLPPELRTVRIDNFEWGFLQPAPEMARMLCIRAPKVLRSRESTLRTIVDSMQLGHDAQGRRNHAFHEVPYWDRSEGRKMTKALYKRPGFDAVLECIRGSREPDPFEVDDLVTYRLSETEAEEGREFNADFVEERLYDGDEGLIRRWDVPDPNPQPSTKFFTADLKILHGDVEPNSNRIVDWITTATAEP